MSFQKCPICKGSGYTGGMFRRLECATCNGHGIINEYTGKPPGAGEVRKDEAKPEVRKPIRLSSRTREDNLRETGNDKE